MAFYPEPGEYAQTGLPAHEGIFRAWLFLRGNDALLSQAYRDGKSCTVAKTLIDMGERSAQLLAAALVAPMPTMFHGFMKKSVGPEVFSLAEDFSRHVTTYFTYIDQAPPPVQKLALAYLMHGLEEMEKNGQALLDRLEDFEKNGGNPDVALRIPPDARGYLMIAHHLRGETGNERLEEEYTTVALSYSDFRENYLRQMTAMKVLPADARKTVAQALSVSAAAQRYPRFEVTGLARTPQVRRAYEVLMRHPRTTPANFEAARIAGELLSQAQGVAPATVAAALVGTGLGQPGAVEQSFLSDILGGEVMDILALTAQSRVGGAADLAAAPPALRQIALAQAATALDGAMAALREIEEMLKSPQGPQGTERRAVTYQVTRPITNSLQEIEKTFGPALGRLGAPLLENILSQKIEDATLRLEDVYEMALRDMPRHNPGPRPGPGPGPR